MKLRLFLVVALAGTQAACAGFQATRESGLAAAAPSCASVDRGPYSSEQVARIRLLRDNGESLANVAREVGGTRSDIKHVEIAERARSRMFRLAACDGTGGVR